jgi:hypothetical protein
MGWHTQPLQEVKTVVAPAPLHVVALHTRAVSAVAFRRGSSACPTWARAHSSTPCSDALLRKHPTFLSVSAGTKCDPS